MKFNKSILGTLLVNIFVISFFTGCVKKEDMTEEFKRFVKDYEAKAVPLFTEANTAYFNATISGKEEDYKKAADLQVQLSKIYASKVDFAKLKRFKDSNTIQDELLNRQLIKIYNAYASSQIDEKKLEEMIRLQNETEKKFSTFRAEVNGKKITDNEVENTLKTSIDSKLLEATWASSKEVGGVINDNLIKLVKLRNEAARELGFKNYHEMSLKLSEQDPQEIENLLNELDDLTRDAFAKLKNDIDEHLAKKYNLPKEKLMPWHYENRFFQEAPKIYNVNLDSYYKDKDVVALTKNYYSGLGLPIDNMVAKSDLFEKEGKYQHAYCTNIDKGKDVRVVCNVKPNYNWMGTMLHEFGHAVYDYNIDSTLPWTLREPAHTFTTEAIAMMFGRMASNGQWLVDMVGISKEEKDKIADESFKSLRLEQLTFSRWVQVVYRFEKAMYENPDADLNKLWWDLVEKYQMLKRPEGRNKPDYASKIHIALYPAYYHNYLMGELLASQYYAYIVKNVLHSEDLKNQSFVNKPEVGKYLLENIFKPGTKYYWNDMIEKATGEKLTAKYYAKQFVE